MAEISPTMILKSIGGIHFPTSKSQLIDYVKGQNTPDKDRVLNVLGRIDDREYEGPNEILKEVGEVE